MKLVSAIIKPFTLDAVRDALAQIGLKAVTVTEVKGYGQQKGTAERYRGKEYAAEFLPKVKLEVAIDDADLERAIEAIMSSARTGKLGDGKIIVHELVEVVRIRTGETGKQAL